VQFWQVPQLWVQQRLSVQDPDAHSLASPQTSPACFFAAHAVPAQK
jgi:hypothetical protein